MPDQPSPARPRARGPRGRQRPCSARSRLAACCSARRRRRAEIHSYAIVQDDGSLRVQGKTIRLYGIYLPAAAHGCRSDFRPPFVRRSRGARAQDLIRGFVRCLPQARLPRPQHQRGLLRRRRSHTQPPIDLGARLIDGGPGAGGPGGAVRVPARSSASPRQPPRRLGLPGRPGDPLSSPTSTLPRQRGGRQRATAPPQGGREATGQPDPTYDREGATGGRSDATPSPLRGEGWGGGDVAGRETDGMQRACAP